MTVGSGEPRRRRSSQSGDDRPRTSVLRCARMADSGAPEEMSAEQADATITSRAYSVMLIIVAVVGVIVAVAAWLYVEGIYQIQQELFTHLPNALGYQHGPPKWWYLLVLGLAGVLVALAITRLPGDGGHIPAKGLSSSGPSGPNVLPGVILAGLATTGFGLVLGPEGPLIALGAGVATLMITIARRDTPPQALMVIAAAGSFAALAFIFTSPLIAAVILIEATGLGGPKLRVVLIPGLLAAGIGTLVSIGIGSFTGLSTSAYALGPLPLSSLARPTVAEFGWTIALAIVIAVVTAGIMRGGMFTYGFVSRRQLLFWLPLIGLIVAGLAIGFSAASGKSVNNVLFDGQAQLPGLVQTGGRVVARNVGPADPVQGHRLRPVAGQLPRRPHVPGDLPGRGGWDHGLAAARVSGDGGCRGRDRRRRRRRPDGSRSPRS